MHSRIFSHTGEQSPMDIYKAKILGSYYSWRYFFTTRVSFLQEQIPY